MLQAMMDKLSNEWQRERANTQMTLGKMIAALEAMPSDKRIRGLGNPHSYRGYYEDLAFEPVVDSVTAGDLLDVCSKAMGKVFHGYKGGEYVMGELTPVWVAQYGCTGTRLMAIAPDGSVQTEGEV